MAEKDTIYAYAGKILRVNLSNGRIFTEPTLNYAKEWLGSSGIAVGMATNVPPHNLGEVVDAIVYFIDNQDCEIKDLMKRVKGPDFPTGGILYGTRGVVEAYHRGRGIVRIRAKADVETVAKKRSIVVTEIPYMVNKSSLLENIAKLVRDKKIDGIVDLRDESDRQGMRIVVDLRRDANEELVLNQLFARTQMESSFGIINIAFYGLNQIIFQTFQRKVPRCQ